MSRRDSADRLVPRAYVYIVKCADGTLYTGWSGDVESRVAAHNAGKGARYTAGRRPVTLIYAEDCGTKSSAMKREREIKGYSRARKLALSGTLAVGSLTLRGVAGISLTDAARNETEDHDNERQYGCH